MPLTLAVLVRSKLVAGMGYQIEDHYVDGVLQLYNLIGKDGGQRTVQVDFDGFALLCE